MYLTTEHHEAKMDKIDSSTVISEDFNTSFLIMDRIIRLKMDKGMEDF